jgi:hypothetical protein
MTNSHAPFKDLRTPTTLFSIQLLLNTFGTTFTSSRSGIQLKPDATQPAEKTSSQTN